MKSVLPCAVVMHKCDAFCTSFGIDYQLFAARQGMLKLNDLPCCVAAYFFRRGMHLNVNV